MGFHYSKLRSSLNLGVYFVEIIEILGSTISVFINQQFSIK